MKNKLALVLAVWLASLNLYGLSDEYNLEPFRIPPERQGTYIPVVFANQLKQTKLLYAAMNVDCQSHHTVLFLGKDVCYSDVRFHDGYAIKSAEFKNFRFVTNESGTFCIDDRGNSYQKIFGTLNQNGYGYDEYKKYVLNEIFGGAKGMKNIGIQGTQLVLDGVRYDILLDQFFLGIENVALWLRSPDGHGYALIKNGHDGELHEASKGGIPYWDDGTVPAKKVIKEYPLMFSPAGKEK